MCSQGEVLGVAGLEGDFSTGILAAFMVAGSAEGRLAAIPAFLEAVPDLGTLRFGVRDMAALVAGISCMLRGFGVTVIIRQYGRRPCTPITA
jgi:hypothetical protein